MFRRKTWAPMARELKISIGQHSDKGRKKSNQDFHGAMIPGQPLLGTKGIALAMADGVSSSKPDRSTSPCGAVMARLPGSHSSRLAWLDAVALLLVAYVAHSVDDEAPRCAVPATDTPMCCLLWYWLSRFGTYPSSELDGPLRPALNRLPA